MSRSYKKPWVKDPSNTTGKKFHSRAYRSRCKQVSRMFIKNWKSGEEPIYPHKHEITNQYDVYDYRFYVPAILNPTWRSNGCYRDNYQEHLKACRK